MSPPWPESSSCPWWSRALGNMHSPISSRLPLARCSPLPSCSCCQRFDIGTYMHAYMQTFDFHTLIQRLRSPHFMALPSKINQYFPPDPLIMSWCNSANAYNTVINAFHGFIKNTKKQLIVRGLVGNLETVWGVAVYKIAALWPSSPLSLLCSELFPVPDFVSSLWLSRALWNFLWSHCSPSHLAVCVCVCTCVCSSPGTEI